jgi:Flp pilus assembly protein TadG
MTFTKNQKGSFSILAAFGIIAALTFLLFIFDIGQKFFDESRLDDVADFAAEAAVKKLNGTNQGLLDAKNEAIKIFNANGFDITNIESIVAGTVTSKNTFVNSSIQNANSIKIVAKKTNPSILLSFLSPIVGASKYTLNGIGGAAISRLQEFPSSLVTDNIAIDSSLISKNNSIQCNNSFTLNLTPIEACHGPEIQSNVFKRMTNFAGNGNAKTEIGQIVELNDLNSTNFQAVLNFGKNFYDNRKEKIIPVYANQYDYYSYRMRPTIVGYTRLIFDRINQNEFTVTVACGSIELQNSDSIKLSKDSKNNFGLFKETLKSSLIKAD